MDGNEHTVDRSNTAIYGIAVAESRLSMKRRTRWKRYYPTIIGKRFFDGGEFGLGFFTVLKAYKCKTFDLHCETPDGSNWFPKRMIVIKTDEGLKYKMPYAPWLKIADAESGKLWCKHFDEHPW